jgi:hypothetical protein
MGARILFAGSRRPRRQGVLGKRQKSTQKSRAKKGPRRNDCGAEVDFAVRVELPARTLAQRRFYSPSAPIA